MRHIPPLLAAFTTDSTFLASKFWRPEITCASKKHSYMKDHTKCQCVRRRGNIGHLAKIPVVEEEILARFLTFPAAEEISSAILMLSKYAPKMPRVAAWTSHSHHTRQFTTPRAVNIATALILGGFHLESAALFEGLEDTRTAHGRAHGTSTLGRRASTVFKRLLGKRLLQRQVSPRRTSGLALYIRLLRLHQPRMPFSQRAHQ